MLSYPSINKQIIPVPVYAMDKLDGSNIRVEWSAKKGFMDPNSFIRTFDEHVDTPGLLHAGKPTADFVEEVKNGTLDGMTFEGVVCKSMEKRKGQPVVFKVKNDAWLKRLREFTKDDGELFKRLA